MINIKHLFLLSTLLPALPAQVFSMEISAPLIPEYTDPTTTQSYTWNSLFEGGIYSDFRKALSHNKYGKLKSLAEKMIAKEDISAQELGSLGAVFCFSSMDETQKRNILLKIIEKMLLQGENDLKHTYYSEKIYRRMGGITTIADILSQNIEENKRYIPITFATPKERYLEDLYSKIPTLPQIIYTRKISDLSQQIDEKNAVLEQHLNNPSVEKETLTENLALLEEAISLCRQQCDILTQLQNDPLQLYFLEQTIIGNNVTLIDLYFKLEQYDKINEIADATIQYARDHSSGQLANVLRACGVAAAKTGNRDKLIETVLHMIRSAQDIESIYNAKILYELLGNQEHISQWFDVYIGERLKTENANQPLLQRVEILKSLVQGSTIPTLTYTPSTTILLQDILQMSRSVQALKDNPRLKAKKLSNLIQNLKELQTALESEKTDLVQLEVLPILIGELKYTLFYENYAAERYQEVTELSEEVLEKITPENFVKYTQVLFISILSAFETKNVEKLMIYIYKLVRCPTAQNLLHASKLYEILHGPENLSSHFALEGQKLLNTCALPQRILSAKNINVSLASIQASSTPHTWPAYEETLQLLEEKLKDLPQEQLPEMRFMLSEGKYWLFIEYVEKKQYAKAKPFINAALAHAALYNPEDVAVIGQHAAKVIEHEKEAQAEKQLREEELAARIKTQNNPKATKKKSNSKKKTSKASPASTTPPSTISDSPTPVVVVKKELSQREQIEELLTHAIQISAFGEKVTSFLNEACRLAKDMSIEQKRIIFKSMQEEEERIRDSYAEHVPVTLTKAFKLKFVGEEDAEVQDTQKVSFVNTSTNPQTDTQKTKSKKNGLNVNAPSFVPAVTVKTES